MAIRWTGAGKGKRPLGSHGRRVIDWNMATGAYQKYTTLDGLISNYVTGAAQDKDGNLWFVTIEGVTEYNGKTWQNFPNTDINSAMSIGVTFIAFDSKIIAISA